MPKPRLMQTLERDTDKTMSVSLDEDDYQGDVFLDEDDTMDESNFDEEDLPDVDDGVGFDAESADEADDSIDIFTCHTYSLVILDDDTDLYPLEDAVSDTDADTDLDAEANHGEIYTVACSPIDPLLVATGGSDERGFLWKIRQGDESDDPFELLGHNESVSAVAFSTDGQLLASGSLDGIIQVWDVSLKILKCTLEGPRGGIEWIRWHPRGHAVLAASNNSKRDSKDSKRDSKDSTVSMWNADTNAYLHMFLGHGKSVTCGDFTPDGKIICTGSDDATLRIWNSKNGDKIHIVRDYPYHTNGLTCLAISSDSSLALTGSKDGSVRIVNITTGKVVSSLLAHSDSIECVAFAPSSAYAATGSLDKKLIVWDMQHSSIRCQCNHEDKVTCLTWLGASKYIATGCLDGKVCIWDSLSGECARIFRGHSVDRPIQSLAISAGEDYLVSVSRDGTARVFEIAEFKQI